MAGAKIGRPLEGDEPKKAVLSLRTSPDLRQRIEQAAERGHRSLAQEIELRLEMSFDRDNLFHGDRNYVFMSMAVAGIAEIERQNGQSWTEDPNTYRSVKAHLLRLLSGHRPPEAELSPELTTTMKAERKADAAEASARKALEDFKATLPTQKPRGLLDRRPPERGPTVEQYDELTRLYAAVSDAMDAKSASYKKILELLRPAVDAQTEAERYGNEVGAEWFKARGPRRAA